MTTPDELRAEIESARAMFRAALRSIKSGWEAPPDGDEWTRREIAEHAIGADIAFSRWAVALRGGTPEERPELALKSPSEALEAFATLGARADAAWAAIEADDLPREVRPERTVEGAMELVARHLREHAEQIGAA